MFEEFVRKISGLQIENVITGDVREGRGDEMVEHIASARQMFVEY